MSIKTIDLSVFKQDFTIKNNNKQTFGEVHTDFKIVEKMLNLIPVRYFKDPTLKWLDPVLEEVILPWFFIKNFLNI